MPKRILSPVGFYGLAFGLAALDQAVKALVVAKIPLGVAHSIPLWPGVFHLTHVQNPGIAFSLLEGKLGIIALAAILVMAVIVVAERRARGQMPLWQGVALALPLGGALGNLIDRLRQGYVTDFFDFTLIHFPVFNVADSCITIGILLLAWRTLMVAPGKSPEHANEPAPTVAPISGDNAAPGDVSS